VNKDQAIVANGSELIVQGQNKIVLEEYALNVAHEKSANVVTALEKLTTDPLWTDKLAKRLVILHDEDFQHFVSTCTEVVARIVINPATRTNTNLFNQENIPCETLFYTVITLLNPRRNGFDGAAKDHLSALLKANPLLQIGGDETTGHGFCQVKHEQLKIGNRTRIESIRSSDHISKVENLIKAL
jgi:CRISPR-associated protein Cmr4